MVSSEKNIWIGFDLGGTKMLTIAYDDDWKVVGRRRRKTRGRDGSDKGVQRIASTIERLLEENELKQDQIAGIGIGCPGPIDLDKGRILTTPNLGWDDIDVGDLLKKRFGCPVVVLNDVDAGVFGEYEFVLRKVLAVPSAFFPVPVSGVDAFTKARSYKGPASAVWKSGTPGLAAVLASGYTLQGTVEAEASRLTIAAEAAKAAHRGDAPFLLKETGTDLAEIRSGALADSVSHGDKAIRRLVEDACESLGVAVVNIVHLLSPDKIVLGGGLVEAMEELIVSTVRKTARERVMSVYRDRFEVVAAKLGDDAGVQGAAAWAKKRIKDAKK